MKIWFVFLPALVAVTGMSGAAVNCDLTRTLRPVSRCDSLGRSGQTKMKPRETKT